MFKKRYEVSAVNFLHTQIRWVIANIQCANSTFLSAFKTHPIHTGTANTLYWFNDVLQASTNVKNNKYKDVYGLVTRRLHLPSYVCPVRSTLTFFGFSGFLLTNSGGCTMRAWARRIRSEMRLFDGRGPRYSTMTRLQLVGPAPPAAI